MIHDISRLFLESFKIQVWFKCIGRMFEECFRGVSRVLHGVEKEVSEEF